MQVLDKNAILESVPQKAPFRFIDDILEINENCITGTYTFKPTEFFYQGHFPNNPITPGVILLETMAQTGVVAFGLYLTSLVLDKEAVQSFLTLFSEVEGEFYKPVLPGEKVTIEATKVFFRRMKLKVNAKMFNHQGELVAMATLSGMGVKKS